jgi:hypothetical protein
MKKKVPKLITNLYEKMKEEGSKKNEERQINKNKKNKNCRGNMEEFYFLDL